MQLNFLKSKIHRATVTDCNLHYEGSVGIDKKLMEAVGLRQYEQIDIYNITNGERLTTYVIEEEAGSGKISIRGSAAHKASVGDLVILCSYCQIDEKEAESFKPSVVRVDKKNQIEKIIK